ncbi:uncharacterized protein LOC120267278 [Dioscorea cayenensis subsp. rotundata]|uniref:Uncharacterized protein LOC120267278 n=1 Tax=Dioscorea cayennensis subsp. rotundata TaxID=55577 RepID=A0AB40BTW9_DIOCR|nr:uncharacterized protein LOC120267278 [Dioscorea cayenensis subsp. rotundata]
MSRSLFLRILNAVQSHDNYFQQQRDVLGRLGFSPLQKVTAVFRMLAYGLSADATDEYVKIAQGIVPPTHYIIQGKEYNMGYYLANNIYSKWSTIVQTIHEPRSWKKKYFAMKQESCKKDVECAFGVLQLRFAIVARPIRFWSKNVLCDIMTTCIIMHNMIVEDERDLSAPVVESTDMPGPTVEVIKDENARFEKFVARYK